MHFVSAGGLALSVGEIMLKSDTALYHFCTINSIKKKLSFSFDSPSYVYTDGTNKMNAFRQVSYSLSHKILIMCVV